MQEVALTKPMWSSGVQEDAFFLGVSQLGMQVIFILDHYFESKI
jgi:hypothetical protein